MDSPNVKKILDARGIAPTPCWSSVGDGWIPIVERCLDAMIAAGWDKDLSQVKEKFGRLRVYVGAWTEELEAIIDDAAEEASRTCEQCGSPGRLRSGEEWRFGWMLTLCDAHAREVLEKRKQRDAERGKP